MMVCKNLTNPALKDLDFLHNDAGNDLSIQQGDTNNANYVTKFNISSAGNVGIATTAPAELLHLKGGTGNDSAEAPIIRIQKHSGGAVDDGQTIGGMSFWVNDDGVDSGASKERAKIIAESQNTSSATRLEFLHK